MNLLVRDNVEIAKPLEGETAKIAKPEKIDIFLSTRDGTFKAKFIVAEQKIEFGKLVVSPSRACRMAYEKDTNCNGWKVWKFMDGSGNAQPISALKK